MRPSIKLYVILFKIRMKMISKSILSNIEEFWNSRERSRSPIRSSSGNSREEATNKKASSKDSVRATPCKDLL